MPETAKFPNLFVAFSDRSEGNMAYSILGRKCNLNVVLQKRTDFLKELKVDIKKCIYMRVKGGDGIKIANKKNAGVSMEIADRAVLADALVTEKKNLCLFMLTADCIPVILFDPRNKVLSLVHAGWKGVDLEIVKKAIRKMSSRFLSDSKNIIAAIGPCARKETFIKKDPEQLRERKWAKYIHKVEDDFYSVDFVGFCKKQLIEVGVREKNLIDCGIDTIKDDRFFSHYRDKKKAFIKQGRFACIASMV